ncbi:fimbrial protein [Photorhabdus laumondii]|uniref:fimbrial protein n=1 Tax=Photorhabdus laumondii TaxID=2218628 RepID=UPI003315FF4E
MKRQILKISVVAALVLGVASAASAEGTTPEEGHVGKNTMVTITGNIVAATCDVVGPPSADGNVDLGNVSIATFEAAKATELSALKSYSEKSQKKFDISVTNCDEKNTEAGKVKLIVTGTTLRGSDIIFSKDQEKNAGVALTYSAGTTLTLVKNGSEVLLSGGTAANHFNDSKVEFTAYLAAKSSPPDNGRVEAPITFSYAYN